MLTPTIPATAALSAILLTLAACRTDRTTTGDGAVTSAAAPVVPPAITHRADPGARDAPVPAARPVAMASQPDPPPGDAAARLQRPGYDAHVSRGRLWVFRAGSKDRAAFLATGEPAKSVTRPGAGPEGMTIRAVDAETIDGYLHSTGAFAVFVDQGRLWVLRDGSKDLEAFLAHGEPARSVTRPGAGPDGMTIRSGDAETIDAYLYGRPGFFTKVVDGRLWVLRDGSKDLEAFLAHGEPARSVTRPGAGPNGMTIRSGDAETIEAYLAARRRH